MANYTSFFYKIYHWLAKLPPRISWSTKRNITEADKQLLATLLASGYYIILTSNKSHLSGVIVSFLSWVKTGKWARYSHALMNCDNITDPRDRDSFKFVEATAVGVHYSTFNEIFDCDTVCLLTPVNISNEEWTVVIDTLIGQIGTPYDDLFDLMDATHISCVESVLVALKSANYKTEFAALDEMITQTGNLVPQMYRDCPDFTARIEL
jgi:hypothetical protein